MWSELGCSVFNNGEIIKIGFSLTGDITMFQKTLPALGISLQGRSSYIDLQIVWRKVNVMDGFYFPYRGKNFCLFCTIASYSTNSSIGLSTLVELCLGKQLDKSNQLSNWGNRPLRKDQIIYAALDAYCLLELYDIIQTKLNSLGIDITDFTDNTLFDSILKKSKKKPPANKQKVEIVENELVVTSNRATKVKFLCDEIIEGPAKSLRKCGIDSVCMLSTFDRTEFTNRALNENRIALTKGLPYVERINVDDSEMDLEPGDLQEGIQMVVNRSMEVALKPIWELLNAQQQPQQQEQQEPSRSGEIDDVVEAHQQQPQQQQELQQQRGRSGGRVQGRIRYRNRLYQQRNRFMAALWQFSRRDIARGRSRNRRKPRN